MKRLTRYAGLIAGASLLTAGFGGCATTQTVSAQCGSFDTELLRADMKDPFRTDREWYESIVGELARQLDCERRTASADF
mgnify:CR=1 FL=1|jgi:hypothetical protein